MPQIRQNPYFVPSLISNIRKRHKAKNGTRSREVPIEKWVCRKKEGRNIGAALMKQKRRKHFSLKKVSKASLDIIERWFATVADSKDFLELDFTCVSAVLNSSELLIDSELQVFNALNAWLNHNSIERSKYAKYLLQRVRLSLLTIPALNNILCKNLWITENDERS